MPYEESRVADIGEKKCTFYEDALEASRAFREEYERRKKIVKAADMPWELSPDGKIKHVINERLNVTECAIDIYIQFLDPGSRSGKHRHISEEVFFVLEGRGYDLHWDVDFHLEDDYTWVWSEEPKRFEWKEGDFVYIPPYSIHQHFNSDQGHKARLLIATSRIPRYLGFDWHEQLENAPEQ
ncbi:MAG: cupin domain-containing protein [Deltaproteobacteria bacterium]|nr:cupin domain-containing protein [Deltaproteobacteria bacterium]